MKNQIQKALFILAIFFCLTPYCSGALALLLGLIISLTLGNPYVLKTKKYTSNLLQLSVIGLGAGMNLKVVAAVGLQGIGYTVAGILFAGIIGFFLTKILKTNKHVSMLITIGTAICGGSAIAAAAPVLNANDDDISVSLAAVFILNAAALFLFPSIGHFLELSQHQFGLWAALAIHDTSSVVGASLSYGSEALAIATTVKLARALWIIPVTFGLALFVKQESTKKAKRPWFILGFLLVAAIFTWVPGIGSAGHLISDIAKRFLVVTLFFIGSALSLKSLKVVGLKPLVLAIGLWIIIASTSLYTIKMNFIH
jgi:uncharacterized integral membrane protein (TIGR00698 family)